MDEVCKIQANSCDYYLCAEKTQHCGRDGYYQKFAYPYCSTFLQKTVHQVSPQGQKWLRGVAACLQKKLSAYTRPSDPCWLVEQAAIETHAECYVEAGGCELDVQDLAPVVSTFWQEFADSRVFWQGIDYVTTCAKRF